MKKNQWISSSTILIALTILLLTPLFAFAQEAGQMGPGQKIFLPLLLNDEQAPSQPEAKMNAPASNQPDYFASGFGGNSSFTLVNARSSHCVDVDNGATTDRTNIKQWHCSGHVAQLWEEVPAADGFMLRNPNSRKCIDVEGGSTAYGANVILYTCTGSANQILKWQGTALKFNHSGNCLDVNGGSTVAGANIQQWACNGSGAQSFTKNGGETPPTGISPSRIFQAHQFSGKSGAVSTEGGRAGDGTSIGFIGAGDWVKYSNVDFKSAGTYNLFMATVAVPNNYAGKSIEVRIDSATGPKIGQLNINATGGWDRFTEQYAAISTVSGVHDLYLVFPQAPVANVDWFVFGKNPDDETAAQRDIRMQWWRDARFGQFIHWGAYSHLSGFYNGQESIGGAEWIMRNSNLSKTVYERDAVFPFNPSDFDANTWAQVAKDAGQKYVVITSKHHDGFAVFDTKIARFKTLTNGVDRSYDVKDAGSYGRDPMVAYAAAIKAQGLKFAVYYSIWDWHHPSFTNTGDSLVGNSEAERQKSKANYVSDMKEQLREIIEAYDPALIWFDGEWTGWWTRADGDALYKYLRVLSPNIIINDRVGKKQFLSGDGDYDSTAERIGPANDVLDWENSQTMNGTWGYRSSDTNWKPTAQLLEELVSVTAKNGNYLLNVGPDGRGVIPAQSVSQLQEMGNWLSTYGESIYGTLKPNPFVRFPSGGYYTVKGNRLFAILKNWPNNGTFTVSGLVNSVNRVYPLNAPGTAYSFTKTGENLVITGLPSAAPNQYFSVIVIETVGTPEPGDDSNSFVTFYVHENFGGASWEISEGTYEWPAISSSPVGNDAISSIKIPQGYAVKVCKHGSAGEPCETYRSSVTSLGAMNDAISYIKITSE